MTTQAQQAAAQVLALHQRYATSAGLETDCFGCGAEIGHDWMDWGLHQAALLAAAGLLTDPPEEKP